MENNINPYTCEWIQPKKILQMLPLDKILPINDTNTTNQNNTIIAHLHRQQYIDTWHILAPLKLSISYINTQECDLGKDMNISKQTIHIQQQTRHL